ncbi:Cytoplasmic dynein 1 intermediate chain [Cyphomyrmex costatus]|uniref:Cytoplasmic dynein 1 intermediate chain n=1 Tax=Cyphomyrmex costatus TaxID=456900 RepID=A0A195D3C7_9HYME|nr:Cytoplasmic dynein 1 intermediate chain [Cyphomyrmex costatus]
MRRVINEQRLWLNRLFICERWSCNRCVISMNWSPQFPELLAALYNNNDDVPNGVYLIWNTKFKKITPEFIFHCQSPVISTTFARFHPNLILDIASIAYFGQIVLLDNRVQKKDSHTTYPFVCYSTYCK